jgi:hypothetical protein
MKRIILLTTGALIAVLIVAACGAATASTTPFPSADAAGTGQLPELTRLLVGTLQLEDTDLAITAEQAQALLPLWKMARNLSSSDSAAEAELAALAAQVREAMTAGQTSAIDAMELSSASVMQTRSELGLVAADAPTDADSAAAGVAGQVPQGVPGSGRGAGSGIPGQEGVPPADVAQAGMTPGASGAGRGGLAVDALYEALVTRLTERAATLT